MMARARRESRRPPSLPALRRGGLAGSLRRGGFPGARFRRGRVHRRQRPRRQRIIEGAADSLPERLQVAGKSIRDEDALEGRGEDLAQVARVPDEERDDPILEILLEEPARGGQGGKLLPGPCDERGFRGRELLLLPETCTA